MSRVFRELEPMQLTAIPGKNKEPNDEFKTLKTTWETTGTPC
jgi:hypothetical protein